MWWTHWAVLYKCTRRTGTKICKFMLLQIIFQDNTMKNIHLVEVSWILWQTKLFVTLLTMKREISSNSQKFGVLNSCG